MSEPIAGLPVALAATRQVVAGIADDQWPLPTPCADWTVAELTAHLISGNRMFAAIMRGGQLAQFPASARAGGAVIDGDRLAAYDQAAGQLLAAFGSAGALDRVVTVPFGTVPAAVALQLRITEVLVHGWDLARATGQRIEVPDSLAELELAFSRRALAEVPPDRSPFGPPQPARPGASPLEQLAGLLGRTV